MATLPQSNFVPGVKAGIAHAIANATATLSYAMGLATKSASKTYRDLQPASAKALAANLAAIGKA